MSEPELTSLQKAGLLVVGIESAGLDADAELDRIAVLPPGEYVAAMDDWILAGISARSDKLPGGPS